MNENERITPFLRWAGGKNWLVPYVGELIEQLDFNNYYEPFLGGAAVFLSLNKINQAFLSDLNGELVDTYNAIKHCPDSVIGLLKEMDNTKEDYYKIREENPETLEAIAARFIYLNQTSYNGLYRVNKKGEYNVPYGYRNNWNYDFEKLNRISGKLQSAEIACGDFSLFESDIKENDLVFLDPPYTVSHNQNGFIKYNQKLFSLDDQYRLRDFINSIAEKQAYYILTNAAHEKILEIFSRGDTVFSLDRNSLIGGKNASRSKVSEFVFTNVPVPLTMESFVLKQ